MLMLLEMANYLVALSLTVPGLQSSFLVRDFDMSEETETILGHRMQLRIRRSREGMSGNARSNTEPPLHMP